MDVLGHRHDHPAANIRVVRFMGCRCAPSRGGIGNGWMSAFANDAVIFVNTCDRPSGAGPRSVDGSSVGNLDWSEGYIR